MQKQLRSRVSLSRVLVACSFGFYAVAHFLPIVVSTEGQITWGWEVAKQMIGIFPYFVDRVWRVGADGGDWLVLFWGISVPLYWFGTVLFCFTERLRPRLAGLTATLSGLFALAGFSVTLYLAFLFPMTLEWGFYVWLTSLALLAAAGLCKLMGILLEYMDNRLPDHFP